MQVPKNHLTYQFAHSGVAYVGGYSYANLHEYIESPLSQTLSQGACYHLQMYVNLHNNSKYTSSDIGVYFSDTAIANVAKSVLPFIPQISNPSTNVFDTLNWTLVEGYYTASGKENYIVIGNFKNDSQTNLTMINSSGDPWMYYLMDDVSLVPVYVVRISITLVRARQ